MKIWGSVFQISGVPDLIGSVDGLFFSFEVKTASGAVKPLQWVTIERIRASGAVSEVVRSPQQAVDFVRKRLVEAR
jgi:hypothetical protein